MFDWLHENDHTESRQDRAIEDEIAAAEFDPFVDVPFADHTDRRPDPPKINGRVPDAIRVNGLTGRATIFEKETDPGTPHSREQIRDLQYGARRRGFGFDLDIVDDDGFRL